MKFTLFIIPVIAAASIIGAYAAVPSSDLPNRSLTPGSVRDHVVSDVCTPNYARHARHVTLEERHDVFARYHIPYAMHSHYELDHLVPLEIGGSNRESNLWPQPRSGEWSSRRKDRLENKLHELVCAGAISIGAAQHAIATNWVAAYLRYMPVRGAHIARGHVYSTKRHYRRATRPVGNSTTVWVNTRTGVFHLPGSRWYGRTKEGEYMSISQAEKDGYSEAENGQ